MAHFLRIKRSELYSLVWSKAMIHVAKDVGLSGRGLAKLCRRHDIPVPRRGYWARLLHGHKPKQSDLPPSPQGQDLLIEIRATEPAPGAVKNAEGSVSVEAQAESRSDYRLTVNETVIDPHPDLRRTDRELRKKKPDDSGRVQAIGDSCFSVHVAPASVERCIRILNTLCNGFDRRQYSIATKPGDGTQVLCVTVQDQVLGFSLEERVRKRLYDPAPTEVARMKREPWFKPRRYVEEPTGALILKLEGLPVYGSRGLRWADKQKAGLEERLNEFMVGLIDTAVAVKAWSTEQVRLKLEREEVERRAAEKEARAGLERARLCFLEEQADLWHRRERLTQYLDALRRRSESGQHSPEEQSCALKWMKWAEDYLSQRDTTAIPFFNPLIQPGSRMFDEYNWHGRYGEKNEWFDFWGS
jgi:hypothetical protein